MTGTAKRSHVYGVCGWLRREGHVAAVIATGAAGLIGSETVEFFCALGMDVVGIDNDMRRRFFGDEASTAWNRSQLESRFPDRYRHLSIDIRDQPAIDRVFAEYSSAITLVVHTAAQPSHDW